MPSAIPPIEVRCPRRADGCRGAEVIKEMNRIAMVVDVAHGSDESIRDMVALSNRAGDLLTWRLPVAGRCSAHALTDERIGGIAGKGGVIGIALVSAMLSDEARKKGGRWDPRLPPRICQSRG